MNCKCVHEKVCLHQENIHHALYPLFEPTFPGPPEKWKQVEEMIQDICRFRKPIKKKGGVNERRF